MPQIDVDCFLSEDISFAGKDCHKVYYDLLVQMIKDANPPISLRQVEKVFNYFEAVCGVVSDFDEFTTAPYLFPVAIFSKVLDDDFFHTTFEKRNLKSYYSINGKNTAYSSIYNKIQSYDTHYQPDSYSSSKVGCDSLFKLMHSSHGSEIELPAWYSTNNKKLPICNNGSRIVIIKNNSQDFLRIYNVVDCLS